MEERVVSSGASTQPSLENAKANAVWSEQEEAAFWAWLHKHGVTTDHARIALFPRTGRGMKATRDIAPGELIFRVPQQLFLTARSAAKHNPALHALFQQQQQQQQQQQRSKRNTNTTSTTYTISEDDRLALLLLAERQKGSESFWAPYFPLLPPVGSYDHSMFFREGHGEMHELYGSNLFELTRRLKLQVEDDYLVLFHGKSRTDSGGESDSGESGESGESGKREGLFKAYPEIFGATEEEQQRGFSVDAYRWALATIWSRAFDLDVNDGSGTKVRVLAPFADLFNHSPHARSRHGFSGAGEGKPGLECTTLGSGGFKEGEEIVFNYGAFPNVKLLRLYGFAVDDNPYDIVDIYAPMSPLAPDFNAKIRLLHDVGLGNEEGFVLHVLPGQLDGGVPESLIDLLRIQRLTTEELNAPTTKATFVERARKRKMALKSALDNNARGGAGGRPKGKDRKKAKQQAKKAAAPTSGQTSTSTSTSTTTTPTTSFVISKQNDLLALDALIDALNQMLAAYPTNLVTDLKMLRTDATSDTPTLLPRVRSSVCLRVGEKKILLASIQRLTARRKAISDL
eukprot:TRINITY_DN2447_c0_g1_i1.p1 TRINITY_DN2447_c0_g1~~TRINITY_DN2447_c0_g1_i1.p1  ORF type:complete len:570 (+),score=164.44 TRINITY_DN2447_c0_g1_i1:189-1898(+)